MFYYTKKANTCPDPKPFDRSWWNIALSRNRNISIQFTKPMYYSLFCITTIKSRKHHFRWLATRAWEDSQTEENCFFCKPLIFFWQRENVQAEHSNCCFIDFLNYEWVERNCKNVHSSKAKFVSEEHTHTSIVRPQHFSGDYSLTLCSDKPIAALSLRC